jgi:transposase-like protein
MKKLTKAQKAEMLERYRRGETSEELARAYGITPQAVRWHCNRSGVERGEVDSEEPASEPAGEPAEGSTTGETGDANETGVATVATGTPEKPKPSPKLARTATDFSEAQLVTFVPKTFTTSSIMMQIAMAITQNKWNWPKMSPGDWLDTYIYWTMRQRGIRIGYFEEKGE